jgi:hypothetical protein
MQNQQFIKKADMAVADLSSGGLLNAEQSNAFIRKLIIQPTLLRDTRIVVMGAPQRKIEKIQFGTRIMKPAVEATGLAVGDRSKPTTETVTLTTVEMIAEVRISYNTIEDNIERGGLGIGGASGRNSGNPASGGIKDTIVTLMAERSAVDLEELAILGDTGSGDAYLAQLNGYNAQATSNIVNHAAAPIDRTMFANGLIAMPDQYLRDKTNMRNYVSVDRDIQYSDHLAGRETALGDSRITQAGPNFGHGVPVRPVPQMPNTTALLCNPMNMIWGIQRQISIEVDKDISARVFKIVLTIRCDFKFEEEEAVVKYTNVGV